MSFWDNDDGEDCGDTFMAMFTSRDAKDEKFYFKDIIIGEQSITYKFSFCNDHHFESIILLDVPLNKCDANVMRTVFSIVQCCSVSVDMMQFWDMLYHNISLEYVFVNKLSYQRIRFILEGGALNRETEIKATSSCVKPSTKHSVIIPMGGGKDSLVVWHEYKKTHPDCSPLLMYVADGFDEYAQSWRLQGVMTQTGDDLVLVRHDFQNALLHQVKRSYLKPCAHPWAALVLFDSLLMAQLTGISEVTLGYERSADEGNNLFVQVPVPARTNDVEPLYSPLPSCTKVVLEEVNHQYDKSSAFLAQAQAYIRTFVDREVNVVSTLHGLWELQISKIFCDAPKLRLFLPMFLSCNEPTATCDWCKRCDKCAFIFLLLSAHLPPKEVIHTVFGGENMLANPLCRDLFMRLIGVGSTGKPLDCVGTVQEASAAVHLSAVRYSECSHWRGECSESVKGVECRGETKSHDSSAVDSCAVSSAVNNGMENTTTTTIQPLPVLLYELCQHLCIECDAANGMPLVCDEEAILKLWGICEEENAPTM